MSERATQLMSDIIDVADSIKDMAQSIARALDSGKAKWGCVSFYVQPDQVQTLNVSLYPHDTEHDKGEEENV